MKIVELLWSNSDSPWLDLHAIQIDGLAGRWQRHSNLQKQACPSGTANACTGDSELCDYLWIKLSSTVELMDPKPPDDDASQETIMHNQEGDVLLDK